MKKKKTDIDNYHPLLKRKECAIRSSNSHHMNVVNVVPNANLTIMEYGMRRICEANGLKIEELPAGNCVIFISRDRRYLKALVANRPEFKNYPIVVAQRLPGRLSTRLLVDIAKSFNLPSHLSPQQKMNKTVEEFYERERKVIYSKNQATQQRNTRTVREVGSKRQSQSH